MEKSEKLFFAEPASGKGRGVLVLHAWWGLNDFCKDFCHRLASQGFTVCAPDLYAGKIATTVEEAKKLRAQLNTKQVMADILGAVEQLTHHPATSGEGLSVVGFSLGAYWAAWLSLEKAEFIRKVVLFYGVKQGDYSTSQAAYLGHFAESDDWVALSGVKKLERSLRLAQRPVTFYTYPDTRHWFFEADRLEAYNPEAADLAWKLTVAFLLEPIRIR